SFQLWPIDRITFIVSYPLSILAFSLTIGIPIFLFILLKYGIPALNKRLHNRKFPSINIPQYFLKNKKKIRRTGLILMLVSIIILPRAIVLVTQGGPQNSYDYQMSAYYGPLFELFRDDSINVNGDILTFAAPPGIQYYLPDINIIDLRYAANLAYLNESFNSSSPSEVVSNLRIKGIEHLLFNLDTMIDLDAILGNSLTAIMHSDTLSTISREFGKWIFYDLGPFIITQEIIPLSGWAIDTRYSSGEVSFENNGTAVNFELVNGAMGDRIAAANYEFPHLNLSNYASISFNAVGTNNSLVQFRLYFENGASIDISYWDKLSEIKKFNLAPHSNNLLRGDAFFSVISSDNQSASVSLIEVSLTKVTRMSAMRIVSDSDWSMDYEYTYGDLILSTIDSVVGVQTPEELHIDRITATVFQEAIFQKLICLVHQISEIQIISS
ncbi:MAG: hypothetical protein ACFFEM_16370, partial [Candidatus Thorarchaeota archaeon]